jgi:hypothetical protein
LENSVLFFHIKSLYFLNSLISFRIVEESIKQSQLPGAKSDDENTKPNTDTSKKTKPNEDATKSAKSDAEKSAKRDEL